MRAYQTIQIQWGAELERQSHSDNRIFGRKTFIKRIKRKKSAVQIKIKHWEDRVKGRFAKEYWSSVDRKSLNYRIGRIINSHIVFSAPNPGSLDIYSFF